MSHFVPRATSGHAKGGLRRHYPYPLAVDHGGFSGTSPPPRPYPSQARGRISLQSTALLPAFRAVPGAVLLQQFIPEMQAAGQTVTAPAGSAAN